MARVDELKDGREKLSLAESSFRPGSLKCVQELIWGKTVAGYVPHTLRV